MLDRDREASRDLNRLLDEPGSEAKSFPEDISHGPTGDNGPKHYKVRVRR